MNAIDNGLNISDIAEDDGGLIGEISKEATLFGNTFLWKLGGAPHVHNMAAAGLGSSQWWGFTPALDLTAVYDGERRDTLYVNDLSGMSCLAVFLCYM